MASGDPPITCMWAESSDARFHVSAAERVASWSWVATSSGPSWAGPWYLFIFYELPELEAPTDPTYTGLTEETAMAKKTGYVRWSPSPQDVMDLSPARARDLIVKCLFEAQRETFLKVKKELGFSTRDDEIRKSVENVVRACFHEIGGDYEAPTKEALMKVVGQLAHKSASWGTPEDIIEHHKTQIQSILASLP